MEKAQKYHQIDQQGDTDHVSDDEQSTFLQDAVVYRRHRFDRSTAFIIVGTTIVLVLYSVVVVMTTLKISADHKRYGTRFLESPVNNSFISYVPHVIEQWENVNPDAKIYFTGDPRPEIDENWHNLLKQHCLHMLKEAIMCQGDPTILTMKWGLISPLPIGNLTSPHECVNWEKLMEWVQPNSIDVFQDGMLVHPQNGPIFVNGDFAAKSIENGI
ncbi:hypothetical protein F4808DRAFT_456233 [Astrocystis sublimbata]|nr:hypothetical protein F4808DRAFT_456233 [Astrocystis sublimbata]